MSKIIHTTRHQNTLLITLFIWAVLFIIAKIVVAADVSTAQQKKLLSLSYEFKEKFEIERSKAVEFARKRDLPLKIYLKDERIAEFMGFEAGLPVYYITSNLGAAQTTRANELWPGGSLGLNVTGNGYTNIGEWDGGAVMTTHDEFNNTGSVRVTQGDTTSSIIWHATHVAGTIIAGGVSSSAIGMAYEAELTAWDWDNDNSEMAAEAAGGMELSNHSYGSVRGWAYGNYSGNSGWHWFGDHRIDEQEDVRFGFYDNAAAEWDAIAYDAPNYLIIKAAGNDRNDTGPESGSSHYYYNFDDEEWQTSTTTRDPDGGLTGYDTIDGRGVAKNVLTVGAVYEVADYTDPSDVSMSSFSSWGPADDGRVKPDIVAKGVSLLSCYYDSGEPDNTGKYAYASGTSMAAPNVTGTLALLQNYYQNLNSGTPMSAATLRALVIQTADEAGSSTGPDYQFGWGLLNAEQAAQVIAQDNSGHNVMDEITLNDGDSWSRSVYSDGTEPLRVTIAWTDPPPASMPSYTLDSPDPALQNELDVRLTKDATTYYPWSLDPSNPSNAATQDGENNTDNVEQVYIASPATGDYTITVDHDGTLYDYDSGTDSYTVGSQSFSIIISGTLPPAPSNLATSNLGRNSSDLNWDENGLATTWNIEYGLSGFTQNSGTIVQTSSNPYSLEDLQDNQSYDFYVQAVCGDDTSAWSDAGSFSVLTTPPGHNVVFDGADDYIDVGNVGSVQTIEFWVKPATITEGLVKFSNVRSIHVTEGEIDLVNETDETVYINGQTGGTLASGVWSHVAIVASSSFNANQFQIGFDGNDYLTGSIDEVRLWSAALSQSDVQSRLHGILAGNETDLLAYYPCDHASGTELTDASQNSHHGTLMNMAGDEWMTSTLPAGDHADWMSSGSTLLADMTVTYEDGSSGSLGLFATGTGDDWLQTDDGKLLNKYWGIEEYGSVTATLNFDLSGTSLPSGKSWSDLRLLKRNDKESNWQDVTGLCSHTPTSSEPYFEITQSEFSEYRPAAETPIAVKLAYFEAVRENDCVRLTWLTEIETNLAGFNILRRSDENDQFDRINDKIIFAQGRNSRDYVYTDQPPRHGIWYYRLEEIDLSGQMIHHAPVKVDFAAKVVTQQKLPQDFCLHPNHPNPFNPATEFFFDVPYQAHVKISVYDVLGQHVHTLVNAVRLAGQHKIRWNATDRYGNDVASGVYFLVMTAENHRFKHKMTFLH